MIRIFNKILQEVGTILSQGKIGVVKSFTESGRGLMGGIKGKVWRLKFNIPKHLDVGPF